MPSSPGCETTARRGSARSERTKASGAQPVDASVAPDVTDVTDVTDASDVSVAEVEASDVERWRRMYEINVIGTLQVTMALLPALRDSGRGDVVVLTSTAAHGTYPGGAGYVAAKHGERVIADTLRLELVGEPVRVIEIAPGMVHTEEFSLTRFDGDQAKADAVYAGVEEPLTADDVADAITWTLTRPHHVNIDHLMIRPRAQASNTLVARKS